MSNMNNGNGGGILKKMLAALQNVTVTNEMIPFPDFTDPVMFQKQLSKECCRADRTKSVVSLLVLELACGAHWAEDDQRLRLALVQTVCRRSRLTDTKGWYDPECEQIGIVLPDTDGASAERLVSDIEKHFFDRLGVTLEEASKGLKLRGKIYTYPSKVWNIDLKSANF